MGGISVGMRCGARAAVVARAGCGGGVEYRPVSDGPVRVGKPYSVRGVTYVPAADPGYDYLGYASWYGGESGNRTANGERFRPKAVTAAHVTLPLPSYVEVTAQIGRASGRERVGQDVYISVVAVSLTTNNKTPTLKYKCK